MFRTRISHWLTQQMPTAHMPAVRQHQACCKLSHLHMCLQYRVTDWSSMTNVPACRFLVKVDLEEPDQYSIHDQYDSFSMFLLKREQPGFAKIDQVVRREGQLSSMYDKQKLGLYMWCKRASDHTLRLYLEGMPEIHQMPYLF